MKKLFLLLALLGIVATGCSTDEGGNIPDDAYISLDKEIVTISHDGESVGVKVYSNYAWELTNNCDWITTSITSGDASDTGVTVTLTADLTYDDRDGTILFSCGKAKKLLVVSQKFKEAIIPDGNNTFDIPAEGGHAVITYQTTVDCDVIIPEEAQDWITIAPASRGLVSENINLDIAENTTYSARTAVVKVVAKDNAELAVEYTINQEQKNGVLVDWNNTFNVSATGGSVVIKYQANIDCDVIIPEEAQDWITIVPETRGLVTYNTTLNIAENNSGKERSCVIKVVSKDDNELSAEYTITQKPKCFLYYTSNDGKIVQPYSSSAFGATILSNTYIDGVGVIEFNAPITTIRSHTFYYCSSLTSVTIPDSVTSIGSYAFAWCSSLTSVTIPDSVTTIGYDAFHGCNSLTSVTIPDSVATIGDGAFYECSSLTSVTIPDSVTAIGDYAFYYCSNLTSVTIGESVTSIGDGAFSGCNSLTSVTIPDSVTAIGNEAFYNCYNLTSVYINDIAAWCNISFRYWYSNPLSNGCNLYLNNELVTDLTIPDSVTTIGDYAFDWYSSLTSVSIPDSVTEIGNGAFEYCSSLTSVTIPDSVTSIENSTFCGCRSLTSVTIGDSVTKIGDYAFCDCDSLTSVTIPDSVTSIGSYTFASCDSLTSVTIGDSVTKIGNYAFCDCDSLTSVTIGDSVTTIGNEAFYNCSSLINVTIPESVTTIGEYAFRYCESLTSVYCKAATPPVGGSYMFFNNASGRKIYVPMESVEAYKSASGWKNYADAIVGYDF